MRVVALDTTTRAGSAALVEAGQVVDERAGSADRTHAERLPAEVLSLVDARGLRLADVDLLAVGAGPGSFTGLRIGIATMQGLAFTSGIPVIGVSNLEALGHLGAEGLPAGSLVGVWVDANRGEVFSALYRVTGLGLYRPAGLEGLDGPSVADPVTTLEHWSRQVTGPMRLVGDGAVRYAEVIAHVAPMAEVRPGPAQAGAIARLAAARFQAGESGDPAAVHPLYVRRPDAEIERERRA